jgi:hypothetical protein
MDDERFYAAIKAFDSYNQLDPNTEVLDGKLYPKEILYSLRMTERLSGYAPDAPESIKLAARCQHIGRWEISRTSFPMDRKGYLQWRSKLALHHSSIAGRILEECGYDIQTIDRVKFLLQKKQLLQHHPETQLLEDVVCLVFIEHYLQEFAQEQDPGKVVEIVKKTIKKMSARAIATVSHMKLPPSVASIISEASSA